MTGLAMIISAVSVCSLPAGVGEGEAGVQGLHARDSASACAAPSPSQGPRPHLPPTPKPPPVGRLVPQEVEVAYALQLRLVHALVVDLVGHPVGDDDLGVQRGMRGPGLGEGLRGWW
jgi:hypothetical protein